MVLRLGWIPYGIIWRECRRLWGDEVLDAQLTVWHGIPVVMAGRDDGILVVWRMTTRVRDEEKERR